MTVENTSNKQTAQQMGTLYDYQFTFDILLKDPTAAAAQQAIKAKVKLEDGTEIDLTYGTDYSVTLNSDRSGGHITVVNRRTSNDYITIYREHSLKQETDYQDFNASPAETFEQCFDKLTMLEQQQQEEINRCVKVGMTSGVDPELLVEQVERVYVSIDNIDTVADIAEDVEAVADNETNITAVANNNQNITTVAEDKVNIDAAVANESNINAVVANSSNINTVAGISTDVTSVAGVASSVPTVAAHATNIDTNATNISDINTCASNIADIQTASTNAALSKQYAIGVPTEPEEGSAKYWAQEAARGQVQTDWAETDTAAKTFIKNKPTNFSSSTDLQVSTSWTGTAAPYTQTISVSGLLATDLCSLSLKPSSTYETAMSEQEEYAKIYKGVAAAGQITLYADEPTYSQITVQLIKNRY